VLEHVASPVPLVTAVYNGLKPGGNVCITVPRLDRLPRIFDIEADRPPHHLTLWTEKALGILLAQVGFKEIRIVEKPLMVRDFLLHAMWRSTRVLRSVRTPDIGKKEQTALKTARARRRVYRQLMLRRIILASCRPADWLLRATHLGRGHTLLAYGEKPI
jgi:hypothetical protein